MSELEKDDEENQSAGDELAQAEYKFNPENPATPAEEAAPEEAPTVAPEEQPTAASPAPTVAPAPVEQAPVEPIAVTPEDKAQKMLKEQLDVGNDMRAGAIHPKTYHDLMADKSTLGKIGTIFGLMLSGAGAGLTNQPNALLGMMDKEIERDLESQKLRQTAKQNWYQAALAYQRQQPEVQAAYAKASAAQSDAARRAYENKLAGIDDVVATADASNHMRSAAVQEMQNSIDKMPPGPQKDNAQSFLDNQVKPSMLQKAAQTNLNARKAEGAIDAMNPAPANPPPVKGPAETGKKYDSVNENKMRTLIQRGSLLGRDVSNVQTGEVKAIGPESAKQVLAEKGALESNRNTAADYDKTFHSLLGIKNGGQIPGAGALSKGAGILASAAGTVGGWLTGGSPGAMAGGALGEIGGKATGEGLESWFQRERATQVDMLAKRLGISPEQANSILPGWQDDAKTARKAYESGMNMFKNAPAETGSQALQLYGLKNQFPNYSYHEAKGSKKAEEKSTSKEAPIAGKSKAPEAVPGASKFYLKPGEKNPFQE